MQVIIHKAEDRGVGEYEWLSTRYSFSFGEWFNPEKMGFGALRVLNDDAIAPMSGFPLHSHRNMEIITIVWRGEVTHTDTLGNKEVVRAGDVQVMSAGTGVTHSEHNEGEEPLELFQIWIEPENLNIPPRYDAKHFDFMELGFGAVQLVGKDSLPINQNARITYVVIDKDHPYTYDVSLKNGIYIFGVEGLLDGEGERLKERDALGVWGTESVTLRSEDTAKILVIEVPMETD